MFDKKEYNKQYYEDNREKLKEKNGLWHINNPGRHKESNRQWLKNNPRNAKKAKMKWYKNNLEIIREYQNNRQKNDLKYNINHRMRTAIGIALKGDKAGRKWEALVGYTLNDLISHLIKTIPKGYNWQDFLKCNLHIDHIIPKSVFNYTKPEHTDFKRCWALENLQLLPAKENFIKHNNLSKAFQPALKLIEEMV